MQGEGKPAPESVAVKWMERGEAAQIPATKPSGTFRGQVESPCGNDLSLAEAGATHELRGCTADKFWFSNCGAVMDSVIEAVDARHGRFFVLRNDLFISRSMIEYGEWTESEFTLMAQLLRPGDTVIDVGANIGCLTVPFARTVGPQGCVYGFEPQPGLYRLLAANTVINGLHNVRLFNAACSDRPDVVAFDEADYTAAANYGALSVEALTRQVSRFSRQTLIVTLDAAIQHEQVRLIKIDVEGAEAAVLRGARELIRRTRPALYVELEFPHLAPETLEQIFELNYEAYWHIPSLFEEHNFCNNKNNVFEGICCVNALCLPQEAKAPVQGLRRVASVNDYPVARK
ncbi:MAG: FkbM family methyltransferase [Methylocystis sp.]